MKDDAFKELCEFTRRYLEDSAARSEQEWVRAFPRSPEYRWYHTLNVLRNAERILAEEGIVGDQAEVARAAAVLHDVAIFDCDHSVHGQASAEVAESFLSTQAYPQAFVRRVSRAIAEHGVDFDDLSPEVMGERFSSEGKIVIEADILDKLGASAIVNALLVYGHQDRLSFECHALLSQGQTMQRAAFFKDYLWTETGKRLAEERFGFFLRFLDQLADEVVEGTDSCDEDGSRGSG